MSAQKFVVKKKAKTGGKESKQAPTAIKPVVATKEVAKIEEVIKIPPAKMQICVVGRGAIAGTIAGLLKSKMRNVFMVVSSQEQRLIRSNGLKLEGPKGIIYLDMDVRETLNQKVDLIILAVDIDHIKEVLHRNHNFLENTIILTTQDSSRAEKIISLALTDKNIVSSVVMFDSICLKPHLINYKKEGKWYIGRPFSSNDDKVKEIAEELSPAFEMVVVDDIISIKWTKLFIHLHHCIPALLGKSLQETFIDLDMAKLAIILLKEGLQALENAGIKLTTLAEFEADKLSRIIHSPLEEAAESLSKEITNLGKQPVYGVVLDRIRSGEPSQVSDINGEFVHLSRFNSIGANFNAKIVNFVHKVEKTKKFFTIEDIKREFELEKVAQTTVK